MKIYYYEGMKAWSPNKKTNSGKTGNVTLFFSFFLLFDFNFNNFVISF